MRCLLSFFHGLTLAFELKHDPSWGWVGGGCAKKVDKTRRALCLYVRIITLAMASLSFAPSNVSLFGAARTCGILLLSFFVYHIKLFCFVFVLGGGGGVIDFWISPSGLWVWSVAKRHRRGEKKMCVRLIFSPIRQWSEKYPAVFDERVKRIAILQAFMELPIFCFFFWNA